MIAWAAGSVLPHDRVVVAHGSLAGHARTQLRLAEPWQYVGRSGGEGLGYALPASVGVALAHKDSDNVVVAFLTDGDTLYLPGALWTAAHERIPLLAIVENDRAYARDAIHQQEIAVARGRDPQVAIRGVQLTSPAVDITSLARAFGVEAADPVEEPEALVDALRRGLEATSEGRPFLIEARRE